MALAERTCGVGESLVVRCSPQQWVRWWDPPETGTVVMMVREGGGARQVEEKGADNAAEPLEDLLKIGRAHV